MAHEETMLEVIQQELMEQRFSRKHIDQKIRDSINNNKEVLGAIEYGVELVEQYMQGQYYASKMARIEQLKELDIPELVLDLIVGIAYVMKEELFTSVTAQLAARLGFDDKAAAITTVAELIAVLCETDLFDITKADKSASLMLISKIPLEDSLIKFVEESSFLPPMVCEPLELTHNYSSGYLTHNDSLILGKGNHHDGDICLDVLNTINKVAFRLDTDFLSQVEEEPTFDLDTQDKIELWQQFKCQSYMFYSLLANQGNRMYFNNQVDKRGRIYPHGYHLNPQGTPFKKSCLELADEELVEGI